MDEFAETNPSSSSSSAFNKSRIPEDTVFYAIFPDISLNPKPQQQQLSSSLQSLHLQILDIISPYTTNYIWQHQPFNLSLSLSSQNPNSISHFHGKTHYGDNIEDEWFIVFLLFEITRRISELSIRVWDTDGEFLLIEAAFALPRWVKPESIGNRVFIRRGELHIVPKNRFPVTPKLVDSLSFVRSTREEARALDGVQLALKNRISGYPERARLNVHRVRVRVPVSVAQVLKNEACFISLAVEGFYDRDIDSMKFAAKMEKFLSGGKGEELVQVSVVMSRAMYAQLVQQTFQAPSCYPMPQLKDSVAYLEAELGMKITCGFEMMYQHRRGEGSDVKGSTWNAFRESLESSGYFKGLLLGSNEYRRLMENAQEYYRNSSLFSRTSEMMHAPVRRIDEILSLSHSGDDFKGLDLHPSDNDAWLYDGEDELNSAILERQKELEIHESKHKKSQTSREHKSSKQPFDVESDDFNPSEITKNMEAFVHKVSSYEGAEVPKQRDSEAVDFDVERFIKDMESIMGPVGHKDISNVVDPEEGSSSDLDLDEYETDSDYIEDGDKGDTFEDFYSEVLNKELKDTPLEKSFVRSSDQTSRMDIEGTANSTNNMDDDFTPVDVDINLVKGLLDSFSSQQGLPGPTSNLLGLMGLQIPHDASRDK
ncbi:hypothetical protein GIB67_019552 [Kingdonia uniflora]|uniref:Protein ecdysoneless homolog n=1 Tax=Kingdonia uniflora TaxID=39325 RepID=A0A7J7N0T8_9MAGN|nr:hypothetical protein GIB67_019552 [Kingdonia uniflora]